MDVQVLLAQESRRDAELARLLADVAERRARRLLHDAAELAGQRRVGRAAGHQRGLDEEHVAAGLGPGDAGRDPGPRGAERVSERNSAGRDTSRARGRRRADASRSVATRAATLRAIVPIWRSSERTPASRVYSTITRRSAVVGDLELLGGQARSLELPRHE